MSATVPPAGRFDLLAPSFDTQDHAANWAFHVARTSRRRCRVEKRGSSWRVLRERSTEVASRDEDAS